MLAERYPVLGKRLFGADGRINRFVNIYLNDEDIRFLENLETASGMATRSRSAGDRRRISRHARAGPLPGRARFAPRRYPISGRDRGISRG